MSRRSQVYFRSIISATPTSAMPPEISFTSECQEIGAVVEPLITDGSAIHPRCVLQPFFVVVVAVTFVLGLLEEFGECSPACEGDADSRNAQCIRRGLLTM